MSRRNVVVRALARQDIGSHYRWLAREAGSTVADRFLAAVDRAFSQLAEHSGLGPVVESRHPRLARLRKWKVDGFPDMRIFYEPRSSGISVVRVIHTSKDWWALIEATP